MAKKTIKINEIAAEIHKHLVTHSTHGYTQGSQRWGGSKKETITVQGYKFTLGLNDYDCSSSYITAWILALSITKYKGILGTMSQSTKGAISTRNIVKVFKDSGLFDIWTFNTANMNKSGVGDGFIKESSHVGMYQGNAKTSEFLIAENGKIFPDRVGDNNGRESVIRSATAYKWEKIVHYNGKADFTVEVESKADPVETNKPAATTTAATGTKYKITADVLNVRNMPSTIEKGTKVVGSVKRGSYVYLTNVKKNSYGNTWGKIASGTYKGKYIAVIFHGNTYAKKA